MMTTMQGSEMFAQMTGRAVEAFSVLADANQKIMRDLVDLSASTAKEKPTASRRNIKSTASSTTSASNTSTTPSPAKNI